MNTEVSMSQTVPAGVFKAKCLEIMDEVARTREPVVVTKYGHAVVKLVPALDGPKTPLFGRLCGSVTFVAEDAFEPEPELWNAERD
jgi:prevent-host-death family protein